MLNITELTNQFEETSRINRESELCKNHVNQKKLALKADNETLLNNTIALSKLIQDKLESLKEITTANQIQIDADLKEIRIEQKN